MRGAGEAGTVSGATDDDRDLGRDAGLSASSTTQVDPRTWLVVTLTWPTMRREAPHTAGLRTTNEDAAG
jgi:hypothetical protein